MSTPYMPSNGSEGMDFMARFCDNCVKQEDCKILMGSFSLELQKEWVRDPNPKCTAFDDGHEVAQDFGYSRKTCPSIHMPRFVARLILEIVSIRVECLNDISEDDARSEGIGKVSCIETYKDEFKLLWNQIYSSWEANPWVWVIEFKRVNV